MAATLRERLTVDETNHRYIQDNKPEIGRFAHFRATYFGKLWIMSKTSWLCLLFLLPAIVCFVYFYVQTTTANVTLPYSGNFGLGYPVVTDAAAQELVRNFYISLQRALFLIPCFIVFFVGLAGVFNVVKYETWGTDVKVVRTFFKGVKNNFAAFMWMGLLVGVCFFLFNLCLTVFDFYGIHIAWKIIACIVSAALLLLMLMTAMFFCTQASVYDLTLGELFKNSFALAFAFILQNLFFTVAGLVPLLLLFLPGILRTIAIVVVVSWGVAFMACVWTIYAQFVYDALFSDKKKKKSKHKGPKLQTVASQADVKAK